MKYLLAICCFILAASGASVAQQKKIVQFSGVIYRADSASRPVPYVTITNKSQKNQLFSANYQGYFSFVAHEGDTILFSAIGYRKEQLIIPTGLQEMKFSTQVKMKAEAINLPMVTIYPWANIDEFTRDFMTMKLADDDLLLAKKNVSKASIAALAKTLPRDGQEMNTFDFQNRHLDLVNKHMSQKGANPLLNPFAWASFIQQITQGDKSRGNN